MSQKITEELVNKFVADVFNRKEFGRYEDDDQALLLRFHLRGMEREEVFESVSMFYSVAMKRIIEEAYVMYMTPSLDMEEACGLLHNHIKKLTDKILRGEHRFNQHLSFSIDPRPDSELPFLAHVYFIFYREENSPVRNAMCASVALLKKDDGDGFSVSSLSATQEPRTLN